MPECLSAGVSGCLSATLTSHQLNQFSLSAILITMEPKGARFMCRLRNALCEGCLDTSGHRPRAAALLQAGLSARSQIAVFFQKKIPAACCLCQPFQRWRVKNQTPCVAQDKMCTRSDPISCLPTLDARNIVHHLAHYGIHNDTLAKPRGEHRMCSTNPLPKQLRGDAFLACGSSLTMYVSEQKRFFDAIRGCW